MQAFCPSGTASIKLNQCCLRVIGNLETLTLYRLETVSRQYFHCLGLFLVLRPSGLLLKVIGLVLVSALKVTDSLMVFILVLTVLVPSLWLG